MKKLFMMLSYLAVLIFLISCGKQAKIATETTVEATTEVVTQTTEEIEGTTASAYELTEEEVAIVQSPFEPINDHDLVVKMVTSEGTLVLKLFPTQAPRTVENFVTHIKNGYYNGQIFHRVIQDFMIQGGDPTGTGTGGESIWGEPFEDELSPYLFPYRGALCMANAGPGTNQSQFFIVQTGAVDDVVVDQLIAGGFPSEVISLYKEHGGAFWLYGKHTVFGQLIEGGDVLDAIASVETDDADKPVEDVLVETVEIIQE